MIETSNIQRRGKVITSVYDLTLDRTFDVMRELKTKWLDIR